MRMRTAAMVGGWALAVAGATAAGWAGVSLIGDEVSPSGPAALSQAEVHRRVQAAATVRATMMPTTAATAPAPVTPDDGASPGGPGSTAGATPDGTDGTAGTGTAGPGGSTGAVTASGDATSAQRRSYTMHGGVVVLACAGDQITANASPKVGFTTKRESLDAGSGIQVEFQSADSESKLVGHCSGGTPSATVQEHGPGD